MITTQTMNQALVQMGRACLQWLAQWWYIARLGAQILAWALLPRSYPREQRLETARHLYQATGPVLLWFSLLSALVSVVLVRIVVVTAQSYGLTPYALEMVIRVLVLELIPLTAALFVALRCAIPYAAEVAALRSGGAFDELQQRGVDPLRQLVLPRVVASVFAVLLLAAVSGVVGLVLTYVIVYGFNPYALPAYTRTVGQIFQPAVTLIFSLKTVLFSMAVAVVPMAAATWTPPDGQTLDQRSSVELQGLVRMFMLLLLVEMVSLVGNYY